MRRARILFLSQCLPYPPHSGVRARTFNILRQLQVDFDITLLAFSRRGHQGDHDARRAAQQSLAAILTRVEPGVPIAAERRPLKRVWDHLRSAVSGRPYTFYEYESDRFHAQLRRVLANTAFDLVHLDSPDLAGWLRALPAVPVTCTHHSIESQLLRRQGRRLWFALLRWHIMRQADLLEKVERVVCPVFRLNLMMSQVDADALASLAPRARTLVVPNGVDTSYFTPPAGAPVAPESIVFVGATNTFPNSDAVEYLLHTLWPLIRRAAPGASVTLVGAGTDTAWARAGKPEGVRALGHVPDIRPFVHRACCSLVPLRVGGGTRLKILDAWAMGSPVVSTSIGCEGLDAVDGHNIVIRDKPEALATAAVEVMRDAALRARLGRSGRSTAEGTYSWDVIGRKLRAAYHNLVGRGRVAA